MADPLPIGVPLARLRPTQMTVGFREVALKRAQWEEADRKGRARLLRRHVIPAVIGPKKRPYLVDHHHFALALWQAKADLVAVYVLADLSELPRREFWSYLDNSAWCHAYDAEGKRRKLSAIPRDLDGLADDPFRSLAGALIREGACAKSSKPFAEFLWADFMRRRLDAAAVEADFDAAVKKAIALARSDAAHPLPGWCGRNGNGL